MATVGLAGNERVNRLREKVLAQTPCLCTERGYWITESYKETESEPLVIRKAKALQKVLESMTISIVDGELIVGKVTSKLRGAPMRPEERWECYLDEMDTLSTRPIDPYAPLTEEEKSKMRDFLPYWRGKSLSDKLRAMTPEELLKLSHKTQAGGSGAAVGAVTHTAVDHEKVLAKGLDGIKEVVNGELSRLNLANIGDLDKYQFLKAINITLEAAKSFAKRYAELARSLAEKETDGKRKGELERIAENCGQVPANPARNFYEALQSVWFIYIVLQLEGSGWGCFGRPDQYLYPFYKRDIEEGKITREEARELIALLLIKTNEMVSFIPKENAFKFAGYFNEVNITLGGLTKDGRDAVNDLSYLFLEAEMDVRLTNDEIVIRIHRNNPDAFVMKACEAAKSLRGKLKFVSDETNIQRLLKDGKPVEYARDYVVTGCFCITVPGRSWDFMGGGTLVLPLMLELALNNGVSRVTGEQIGPRTGDPKKFKSYDEVWGAYKKQVESQTTIHFSLSNTGHQISAQFGGIVPFQSALFHGCIEKGIDILNGGTAPYLTGPVILRGVPNVADSLAAIKKVVFEDKKIIMDRLIDALDKNFEGEEEILYFLRRAPKFGNDDDFVDSIMNEVIGHASDEFAKYKGFAGALATTAIDAGQHAIVQGRQIGALPDGRRACQPIAEGGICAYQGRDVSGPTAAMRSVAKLDHLKFTNGEVVNMKFSPDALKDEQKMRKFTSLIRTYFETGGGLVQFNILSADTLRDAQNYPAKYRDLLVRVATYSAYFVDLPKEAQDNIIARTEFQEV